MSPPARLAGLSRTLLRDDVYVRLRDAIVDGTFAPGEQLRDVELAEWLGVSRTPVREALQRLAQAGLVLTAPGRSTTVSTLDDRAARDAQAVVATMHELAVATAVPLLTQDDLAQMRQANDRFRAAVEAGHIDGALSADDDLHSIPVRAAGNDAIVTVLEQFTPLVRRLERVRFASLAGLDSVTRHARLVDLCEQGDEAGAAAVSRETWQTLEPYGASDEASRVPPPPAHLRPEPGPPARPALRPPRRGAHLGQT
jgi:DNA-binding GntR family transcriptional regulator